MTDNTLEKLGVNIFAIGSMTATVAITLTALDVLGTTAGLLIYAVLASIILFSVFSMIEPREYL